jgi:hypothetical protein
MLDLSIQEELDNSTLDVDAPETQGFKQKQAFQAQSSPLRANAQQNSGFTKNSLSPLAEYQWKSAKPSPISLVSKAFCTRFSGGYTTNSNIWLPTYASKKKKLRLVRSGRRGYAEEVSDW